MKRSRRNSKTAIEQVARRAGEHVGKLNARVRPRLRRAARSAESGLRRMTRQAEVTVQQSVENARQSLHSHEKAYVIGRTARREVCLATGRPLVLTGQRITRTMANYAERRGLLDDLFRAAGGSHAREFGRAAKDLLMATSERIQRGAARVARRSVS